MMPGEFFGKYELMRRLGMGGMGEVWLARDTGVTQREVAIKVVRSEGDARFLESLAQEARTIARIPHHPNMVVLFDVLESPEDLALVMEYVQGKGLRDLLEEHPEGMPWNLLRIVGEGFLEGMAHAHRHSVIHRDLKPDNIRIARTGHPVASRDIKILDWGLARSAKQSSVQYTRGAAGSFLYMSPEQFEEGAQGPYTDVYAASLVLYEMATGHLPFGGRGRDSSFGAIYRGHCHEAPPPVQTLRPDMPMALAAAIMQGLAKRAEERYADAGVLLQVLQPLFSSLPVGTAPTPVIEDRSQSVEPNDAHPGTVVEALRQGTVVEGRTGTTLERGTGTVLERPGQGGDRFGGGARFQARSASTPSAAPRKPAPDWVYGLIAWQVVFGAIFGVASIIDYFHRMGLTVTYFGSELVLIYRLLAYFVPVVQVGSGLMLWRGSTKLNKVLLPTMAVWPVMILLGLIGSALVTNHASADVRSILPFNIYVSLVVSMGGLGWIWLLTKGEKAKELETMLPPFQGVRVPVSWRTPSWKGEAAMVGGAIILAAILHAIAGPDYVDPF